MMENNAMPKWEFKQEEDHREMEEERMEAASSATLYRDIPSAQDVHTPSLVERSVEAVTPMRI